jgi:hypothetical protein
MSSRHGECCGPSGQAQLGVRILRGLDAVAGQLAIFHRMATTTTSEHIEVDGVPALLNTLAGALLSVMSFTIDEGQILRIEVLSDPERLTEVSSSSEISCGC